MFIHAQKNWMKKKSKHASLAQENGCGSSIVPQFCFSWSKAQQHCAHAQKKSVINVI